MAALVNILVPVETLLGLSAMPGEAAGYGLLDAQDARDLVAAAGRHPDTRWCVTAVHPDGTAAGHGCCGAVGTRRPAPPPAVTPRALTRPAALCLTTWPTCGSGLLGSRAVTATTPGPRPATGPAARCSTWSRSVTRGVPRRAAGGPRPGVIWIIRWPGIRAGSRASAIWPRCAVTIIGVSRARDGNSNNRAQGSCDGEPRPGAATRPLPRSTPDEAIAATSGRSG